MTEKELNEVDGALWGLSFSQDGQHCECETTVYKFHDQRIPINEELGSYKYFILTFKPAEPSETIELMQANIGDVRRFIDNHARAGYNGLMVKTGCVPKKTVKNMIRAISRNFDVSPRTLKTILSQV